ncbi:MAG: hypothetical protein ABSG82_08205 [Sedimentisphaerales bacterium]
MKKDLPNVKKAKLKKYFWTATAVALTLLVLILVLTVHKPGRYAPLKIADQNQISRYLTHHLLPTLYNGTQLGEPFEVVITQAGLNDIIARSPWPIKLQNITLVDPQVILLPQQIILMATVKTNPVDLVATVELNPTINTLGQLNLHISSVKFGEIDITAVAKLIGDKAYSDWLSATGTEPNNIAARICRSLLNDEPFEPSFEFSGQSLRLWKIKAAANQITVFIIPASVQPALTPAADRTPAEPCSVPQP